MHFLPPLTPPWYVSLIGGVGLLFVIGATIVSLRAGSDSLLERAASIGALGSILLVVFFFGLLFSSGQTLLEFYVPAIFDSAWAAIAAVICGALLFWLKKTRQARYAALELIGALGTITVCAVSKYGTPFQRATALVAATYFLIRGLDNADKGNLLPKLMALGLRVREMKKLELAVLALAAVMIPAGLIASVASTSDLKPPYLSSVRGGGTPVSALKCGEIWIVCDEAAWRRHDALVKGTEADRTKDARDVEKRAEAYLRKHGL